MPEAACPICRSPTAPAGTKRGDRTGREFALRRCGRCGFAYVENPATDYAQIYDEAYYMGQGADPLVDYAFEFEHPGETVRAYEWRGWDRLVHALVPPPIGAEAGAPAPPLRWLDFGCGCGTLVRHLQASGVDEARGFDTGAWADRARQSGTAILREDELEASAGRFDVITAIDVIEHVVAPVALLRRLRRLLKPGGLLIPLTQNAAIAPRDFAAWSYVRPEIHVSFFTPEAMTEALRQAGFAAFPFAEGEGWTDIVRSRILKNLRVKRMNGWEKMLPWGVLARLADARYKMNKMPAGLAV